MLPVIIMVYVRLLVRMMLAVCASTVVHHIKNQSVLQTARLMITSVCLNKKCVCCSLTSPYSILAAVKVSRIFPIYILQYILTYHCPCRLKQAVRGTVLVGFVTSSVLVRDFHNQLMNQAKFQQKMPERENSYKFDQRYTN